VDHRLVLFTPLGGRLAVVLENLANLFVLVIGQLQLAQERDERRLAHTDTGTGSSLASFGTGAAFTASPTFAGRCFPIRTFTTFEVASRTLRPVAPAFSRRRPTLRR